MGCILGSSRKFKTWVLVSILAVFTTEIRPLLAQDEVLVSPLFSAFEFYSAVNKFRWGSLVSSLRKMPDSYYLFLPPDVTIYQTDRMPEAFVEKVKNGLDEFQNGHWELARDEFLAAEREFLGRPPLLNYFLAQTYIELHDLGAAETSLKEAIPRFSPFWEASHLLFRVQEKIKGD